MAAQKNKLQIYVTDEMKEYMMKQSDIMGVSVSGLVNIIISQYKQQQDVMNFMVSNPDLLEMIRKAQQENQLTGYGVDPIRGESRD